MVRTSFNLRMRRGNVLSGSGCASRSRVRGSASVYYDVGGSWRNWVLVYEHERQCVRGKLVMPYKDDRDRCESYPVFAQAVGAGQACRQKDSGTRSADCQVAGAPSRGSYIGAARAKAAYPVLHGNFPNDCGLAGACIAVVPSQTCTATTGGRRRTYPSQISGLAVLKRSCVWSRKSVQ
jgi:hypothetical protein